MSRTRSTDPDSRLKHSDPAIPHHSTLRARRKTWRDSWRVATLVAEERTLAQAITRAVAIADAATPEHPIFEATRKVRRGSWHRVLGSRT